MAAIDFYTPRMMLKAFIQLPKPQTFFKNTFFKEQIGANAEIIDIDVKKGKRKLAPFVNTKVNGEAVERSSYETDTYRPPLIAPEMLITVDDLQKRTAGEDIYDESGLAGPERVNRRLGEFMASDLIELDDSITRREEWMCASLLCTGKIPIRGKGVNDELDLSMYWHFDDLTTDANLSWDNPDADIVNQIRKWKRQYASQSGLTCDIMVLGSNALTKMWANKRWQDQQKFIQTTLGEYTPKIVTEGIMFVGKVLGVELYVYEEEYLDPEDLGLDGQAKTKQMMEPNKVIITSTKASNKIIYGLIYQVKGYGTMNIPRVPEAFVNEKEKLITQRLSSRPLPIPAQLDAFITATVCTDNPPQLSNPVKDEVKKAAK